MLTPSPICRGGEDALSYRTCAHYYATVALGIHASELPRHTFVERGGGGVWVTP